MSSRADQRRAGVRDVGASSLEYLGAAVVALLLLLGVSATPLAPSLRDAVQSAICTATGGSSCGFSATGPTPYERATSGQYVALGDSFSSGEGAGDYTVDTGPVVRRAARPRPAGTSAASPRRPCPRYPTVCR